MASVQKYRAYFVGNSLMSSSDLPEQDLFERIKGKVNKEPIRQLLLEYKEQHKDILTGGTQEELVDQLKSAELAGQIPRSRLFGLLQEFEENGNQSLLYYSPATAAIRELCRSPEEVAKLLFGADWRKTQGFPKLARLSGGWEVVDFRTNIPGKPTDWLMKIYTYQETKVQVRELQAVEANTTGLGLRANEYVVIYEKRVTESVCLARWNDHPRDGLLELRVEHSGRKDRFELDVNSIWNRLQKAFVWADFQAWELGRALEQMLRECETNNDLYLLGLAHLVDSGEGGVRYVPYTEKDSIDAAPIRLQTIRQILEDGGRCSGLAMTWLPKGSGGVLEDKLRTYAGSRQTNQLVISAQANARAVDYVTDKLRFFAG
ncbi:hypothetical protein [Limnoglobus roseus]|uniref:Uncharacterized protein n=1 Tax=Limnoglobus roseus TaxID=2598579 RepID=A0A5C1AMJ6_9BACT|nr:hypothetical protein [Limnoglobus roseus]QEL19357.1 hypothetical protein PX52LOC_06428 [Limnoglobus roseus]